MFTQLRIQNFKAWKDTGNIRLAPLTVFFGPNSSGKSSLLQFLLLLKQTEQSRDRKQVLNFGGSHDYIELGAWQEMVFGGDAERRLIFEIKWRTSGPPSPEENEYPFPPGSLLTFDAEIGSPVGSPLRVWEFYYTVSGPQIPSLRLGMSYNDISRSYELSRGVFESKGSLSAPVRFYGFPDDVAIRSLGSAFDALEFELESRLDSTLFLQPFREPAERIYGWSGEAPEEVGATGENTIAALLAAKARTLHMADGEPVRFEELLRRWLVRMGVLESFDVKQIGDEASLYRFMVRTPGNRRQVNLADVGFGVSQVLPVLVQLLYAQPDTTLMFEQPEMHLHPRVQSELADLFIETIQMRQGDGGPRGIQCLVESHSEHFLRRLQRRIAEGTLAPEQTALYFCKPGPEGSIIEELQVDKYGRISNWPEDFFGDAIGDTEEQMDAMLRRMEEESNASG